MTEIQEMILSGQTALKNANWTDARDIFEQCVKNEDSAEAQDGLGIALWWLNQIRAAHQHRMRAFVSYKNRGDFRKAARIAAWIAREEVFLNANVNAMQGWFARAERLLRREQPCAEQGWFLLYRASMLSKPEELERIASNVITLAQEFHDENLEAMSIAFYGLAQVNLGQVAKGMASLDESMASAYSGELDTMTINEIFCVMLSACELAGDMERMERWCRTAAQYAQENHCAFLSAYCRTTYGALLTVNGKWQEAELALTEAIQIFDSGHKGLREHALIRLADLRVYQGKLEEAEVLLSGFEDNEDAALPLARLYRARGELSLARTVIGQALRSGQYPTYHHAALLRLLIDLLTSDGSIDEAVEAASQLSQLANQANSDLLFAQAALAQGQIKKHVGDKDAILYFETALSYLRVHEQSILASRARLEMAGIVKMDDPAAAITWAKAALASFQRIGATQDAEEAAQLLRQLGVRNVHSPHAAHALSNLFSKREDEVYALLISGLSNREIGDRLFLSEKTIEHHITSILTKLGVRSRTEAIALSIKDPLNPHKNFH
jgi:DNA-binding NarL/FixJ family response regulator